MPFFDVTIILLLALFNKIWLDGTFPAHWREAHIVPIPKQGKDHTDPKNYRPISLTNCLCKLFERIVTSRLMWYLESKKLIANI